MAIGISKNFQNAIDEACAAWFEEHRDEVCDDCERCTWNPGPDCGKTEHPHCEVCGHCQYRHEDQDNVPERFASRSGE